MKNKILIFIIFTLFIIPFALADSGVPPNSQDAKLITITGDVPPCTDTCQSLGYTSGTWLICGVMTNCGDGTVLPNYEASISNIKVPSSTKPGEKVKVSFSAENLGQSGDYLVEVGIIPKKVATAWELSYVGGGFSVWEWLTGQYETECCAGQENIFAKTVKDWSTNEVDEFTIEIPKAPYEGIKDKCEDNKYWDGEGDYVLYIQITKGCYKDRKSCTTNADCGYTIEDLTNVCDGGYCLQGINYETTIIEVSEEAPPPGDKCTKSNGALCNPPIGLTGDNSGPSDECKSGWCFDKRSLIGGICAPVGAFREGILSSGYEIQKGFEPHQTCIDLGTVKTGIDWNQEIFAGIVLWQFLIGLGGILIFFVVSQK